MMLQVHIAAMVTTVPMVKVHSRNNGESNATPSSQLKPMVPPSLLTSSDCVALTPSL